MTLPRLAVALAAAVVAATPGARAQETPAKWIEDFEKRFAPTQRNAAAEELEQLALLLGIDFHGDDADAPHPSREDLEAYRQASFGFWLDSQLKVPDDSIGSPPGKLKDFLDKRRSIVGRVTALLGREIPDWGGDPRGNFERARALPGVVSLGKLVLAAALVGEREGDRSGAASRFDASWSLYSSLASRPDLTSQLMSIAIGKMQAGALRKMSEPSIQWLDRMSGDAPRRGMLEALRAEPYLVHRSRDPSLESFRESQLRAWSAVAESLHRLSPCEVAKLDEAQIWKPADEEFEKWKESGGDPALQVLMDIPKPNLAGAVRRAGRNLVDRELTAKILELRLEKAASRDGRWPEKFFDSESRVCPESAYEYQVRGAVMSIRFAGSIDEPAAPGALSLPLVFEVRPLPPTRTPTRVVRPTVTPAP